MISYDSSVWHSVKQVLEGILLATGLKNHKLLLILATDDDGLIGGRDHRQFTASTARRHCLLQQVIPLVNEEVEEGHDRDLCCEENGPEPGRFRCLVVACHNAAVDVDDAQE